MLFKLSMLASSKNPTVGNVFKKRVTKNFEKLRQL